MFGILHLNLYAISQIIIDQWSDLFFHLYCVIYRHNHICFYNYWYYGQCKYTNFQFNYVRRLTSKKKISYFKLTTILARLMKLLNQFVVELIKLSNYFVIFLILNNQILIKFIILLLLLFCLFVVLLANFFCQSFF